MEEPILQQNYLTKTYRYKDYQIEILPYFLYEVSIYRIAKDRCNLIGSRFYISDKLLEIEESKVLIKFKTFKLQRFIALLGAPISFIKENNLPIFELYKNKKL